MSVNSARLANVIFDMGKKIPHSEYSIICEAIESDILTLNEYVISYKRKDLIENNLFFSLNDGSRVLISEDILNSINSLDMDRNSLVKYMSESIDNFKSVLKELIDG